MNKNLREKIKIELDNLPPEHFKEIPRMYEFNPEWTITQIESIVKAQKAEDHIGSVIAIYESDLQHDMG